MRLLYTLLIALSLFSFSGVTEILPEFFGDNHQHCSMIDGDCSKEDKTEKEDANEDELGKESILNLQLVIFFSNNSNSLYVQAYALAEFSFSTEDHSPPPELV